VLAEKLPAVGPAPTMGTMLTNNDKTNENMMFLDDEIAFALAGFPPAFRGTVVALMRRAFRAGQEEAKRGECHD
jgi:hypothetical protein